MSPIHFKTETPIFRINNKPGHIKLNPFIPHTSQVIHYGTLSDGRRNTHINQHIFRCLDIGIQGQIQTPVPHTQIQTKIMHARGLPC